MNIPYVYMHFYIQSVVRCVCGYIPTSTYICIVCFCRRKPSGRRPIRPLFSYDGLMNGWMDGTADLFRLQMFFYLAIQSFTPSTILTLTAISEKKVVAASRWTSCLEMGRRARATRRSFYITAAAAAVYLFGSTVDDNNFDWPFLYFVDCCSWMGWWIALAGIQPPNSVRWNVWVILCVIVWNLAMIKMFDAWLYFKQSCVMTQEDFDFVCVFSQFPASSFFLSYPLRRLMMMDDFLASERESRLPANIFRKTQWIQPLGLYRFPVSFVDVISFLSHQSPLDNIIP